MAWKNGWEGKTSSSSSVKSPSPPPSPVQQDTVTMNSTNTTHDNSLAARCRRWYELRVAELVNETASALLSVSSPPPPPGPPVACPCLDDMNAVQVRNHTHVAGFLFFSLICLCVARPYIQTTSIQNYSFFSVSPATPLPLCALSPPYSCTKNDASSPPTHHRRCPAAARRTPTNLVRSTATRPCGAPSSCRWWA